MTAEVVEPGPLPNNWKWTPLSEVAEVNPRRPSLSRADDAPTTFIPMEAVDEASGTVTLPQVRPYSAVKKGYTYFAEGDVLFAKITPCMQNGKHTIADGLLDGVGFGTTEFHVIRPQEHVLNVWVHRYLRQPYILQKAAEAFTGAVGQQRVPPEWLAQLPIPIPPLDEQRRIARMLDEQMAAVARAHENAQKQFTDIEAYAAETSSTLLRELESTYGLAPLNSFAKGEEAFRDGPFGSNLKTEHYTSTGARVIRLQNIGKGRFLDSDKAYISLERFQRLSAHDAIEGDMIVAALGDGARPAGRACVLPALNTPAIVKADCFRVRLPQEKVHPRFLAAYMNSRQGQHRITAKLRGATRPRVTLAMLRELELPNVPLSQQLKFVNALGSRLITSK